ncbi:hypothetical protein ACHAXH_001743 [Discostella pseudostelligera]
MKGRHSSNYLVTSSSSPTADPKRSSLHRQAVEPMMEGRTRARRRYRHNILASGLPFLILLLLLVNNEVDNNILTTRQYHLLFVGADDSLEDDGENVAINRDTIDASRQLTNDVDDKDYISMDESSPLPASLVKAATVGAKIREAETTISSQGEMETSLIIDDEQSEPELMNISESINVDEHVLNPTINRRCHWGKRGCKRVESSSNSNNSESDTQENKDTAISPALTSSSFAGSATAKIKARIMRGSGSGSSSSLNRRKSVSNNNAPVWKSDDDSNKFHQYHTGSSVQNPPQGFKLAGRIVTSPSDGLAYFLDSPHVPSSEDNDNISDDSMMTIPYVYLECGPTIESTTEAFPLMDMVLRHFPASASMGHWNNLGGGVTLENDEEDGGDGASSYIDTNGKNEGQPKLLIALSPIEITVSGNDEESRLFNPGDVILMEDTLGKGHKMNAAPVELDDEANDSHRGQDMIVLMVSLPHTVHFPIHDWLEDEPSDAQQQANHDSTLEASQSAVIGKSDLLSSASNAEERAISGFAPKNLHHNHHRRRQKRSSSSGLGSSPKKPCPLEYDSAYSSLFVPTHHHHSHHYRRSSSSRRTRRISSQGQGKSSARTTMSAFDTTKFYPPPGYTTYDQESLLMEYLPSLRRTMLVGLGLSLTSSFIYCAQILYPPLLALWGGATVILGGALMNVLFTRWSYRRFIADWEEEWRWKREVMKNRLHRETMLMMKQQLQQESEMKSDTLKENKGSENELVI